MTYKRKLLKQLSFMAWCATMFTIAIYFFLLVPDSFGGWNDYITYHIFFILLFITAERRILPWITNRLHKGWWICVYPFILQLLLVFSFVLLASIFLGGLIIEDGWDIVNLWQSIMPLLIPNSLAIVLFISRKGFQKWESSEGYHLQLLNQELIPHMLNANLTKLQPLILMNRTHAIRFVKLNIRMFHYYLSNRKQLCLPIRDELEQVKTRLEMHEISKQKSVFLNMEVDHRVLNNLIPTMLLVNLFENCFSYGVCFDPQRPIRLHIDSLDKDRVRIQLCNDVKEAAVQNVIGTGTSLSRTAALLRHLDPHSTIDIARGEKQFVVSIICCISI